MNLIKIKPWKRIHAQETLIADRIYPLLYYFKCKHDLAIQLPSPGGYLTAHRLDTKAYTT